ncbi:MAG TPA: MFS transporter [Bacillota bacterium]
MGSVPPARPGRLNPALSYLYMVLFSMRFSEAFWVVYLSGRGLSFAMIGLLETVFHVASMLGEIPTGWIADRSGGRSASSPAGSSPSPRLP